MLDNILILVKYRDQTFPNYNWLYQSFHKYTNIIELQHYFNLRYLSLVLYGGVGFSIQI